MIYRIGIDYVNNDERKRQYFQKFSFPNGGTVWTSAGRCHLFTTETELRDVGGTLYSYGYRTAEQDKTRSELVMFAEQSTDGGRVWTPFVYVPTNSHADDCQNGSDSQ